MRLPAESYSPASRAIYLLRVFPEGTPFLLCKDIPDITPVLDPAASVRRGDRLAVLRHQKSKDRSTIIKKFLNEDALSRKKTVLSYPDAVLLTAAVSVAGKKVIQHSSLMKSPMRLQILLQSIGRGHLHHLGI